MKKIFSILSLLSLFFTFQAFGQEGATGERTENACSDNGCKCIDDSGRSAKADIAAEDQEKDKAKSSTIDK